MLSSLMWSWATCWALIGQREDRKQRFEKCLKVSLYGSMAAQPGQIAIWLPLLWREDLLQVWQHLLWCVSVVIPFQLDSDVCWTSWKQCEQWPVYVVRWSLQTTAWKKQTLSMLAHTPSHPFLFSSSFFLSLKCSTLFFFSHSPAFPTVPFAVLPFYMFRLLWISIPLCLVWVHS